MINSRTRRILFALVSEYISNGEPVASQALAKRRGIDLSPASIRAVFAELETLGLVSKPHTSAGRIPTAVGLRLFVDALMASAELSTEMRAELDARYAKIEPDYEAAMRHTSRVLAEVTSAAAVVVSASAQSWTLRDLRFLTIRPNEVLVVAVASHGAVENSVIRTEQSYTNAQLERVNNLLRPMLNGKTLGELHRTLQLQVERERARHDPVVSLALTLAERAFSRMEQGTEVLVEGQAQLINRPDFSDIERVRQALGTLEDKVRLVDLLERMLEGGVLRVLIGDEDEHVQVGHLSVVAAPFAAGTIGVIGPKCMDYPSVVPIVRYTVAMLNRLLPRDSGSSRNN